MNAALFLASCDPAAWDWTTQCTADRWLRVQAILSRRGELIEVRRRRDMIVSRWKRRESEDTVTLADPASRVPIR